ncbi:hypothetical protein pVco7_gp077 [Vibrio phage pVco-7]|uniref:Uncharacterized protein n=1 Tax=Vibrio phage pVco-5 TaxID=1965485 RepID=A0A1W6JUY8_9CAUD|nr:hypothetical protein KNT61_gp078 [Vibrio phage pVco-5]ARM71066.1 hypothetical protein pVco5_077 [Vibrio phage pVco-5]
MKEWYESNIARCFESWVETIQTNPKEALKYMADIQVYRQLLKQRTA